MLRELPQATVETTEQCCGAPVLPPGGQPRSSYLQLLSVALKKMENAGIKAYTKSPDGTQKPVCVS